MTDWKSLRIPADDFDEHNQKRQEMGLTWAEYISGEAPEYVTRIDVMREAAREGAREELKNAEIVIDWERLRKEAREAVEEVARA